MALARGGALGRVGKEPCLRAPEPLLLLQLYDLLSRLQLPMMRVTSHYTSRVKVACQLIVLLQPDSLTLESILEGVAWPNQFGETGLDSTLTDTSNRSDIEGQDAELNRESQHRPGAGARCAALWNVSSTRHEQV